MMFNGGHRMHAARMLDFRMTGARPLSAWNPDTALLRDLSTAAAPVELRDGRDITAAPDVRTLKDLGSVVLVVDDNSFRQEVINAGASVPWGRWELGARQVGVTATTATNHVGTASLTRGAIERAQRTRELALNRARWLPLRDYLPGDRSLGAASGRRSASSRSRSPGRCGVLSPQT